MIQFEMLNSLLLPLLKDFELCLVTVMSQLNHQLQLSPLMLHIAKLWFVLHEQTLFMTINVHIYALKHQQQ